MQRFVLSLISLCALFSSTTLFAADPVAPAADLGVGDEEPVVVSLPTDRQEQIRRQLRQTCKLEVRNKPLKDALSQLATDWNVNLIIDEASLIDESIATDTPVSFRVSGLKRRSALNLILEPHKLGYYIDNEVLIVATATKCKENLITRVYNVREFVLGLDGTTDSDPLMDLIKETIAPESWTDNGGAGSIRQLQTPGLDVIVIRQTEAVHESVLALLIEMHQMRRATTAYQARSRVLGVNPLERSLTKIVSVNWSAKPLRAAVEDLTAQMGVAARWDESLPQAPAKLDQPITLKLDQVEAASVLSAIKTLTSIDFVFTDDSLLMVPAKKAAEFVEYRWYDLSDFISHYGKFDEKLAQPVIDMIRQKIEPDSWAPERKLGVARFVQAGVIHLLSIRQTQFAHRRIDTLLRELRTASQPALPPATVTKAGKSVDSSLPIGGPTPLNGLNEQQLNKALQGLQRLDPGSTLTPELESVVQGNNKFACELYRKLAAKEGNLVFSPLSVSNAFAVLQPGAKDKTAAEIDSVFHFTLPSNELHPAFASLLKRFESPGEGNALRIANRIWWSNKNQPLRPDYLQLVKDSYGAEPELTNFGNVEAARLKINRWVEQKTDSHIKDLIQPGQLDGDARMVITNAVFLDAKWKEPFDAAQTRDDQFHAPGGDVPARFMSLTAKHHYAEVDGIQVLEKPYGGDSLSMILMLPTDPKALTNLEASLTADQLANMRGRLKLQRVIVEIPRFSARSTLELEETLKQLGLNRIWDFEACNLSGMSSQPQLEVSKVLHQTMIEVHEAGTKAAAATAIVGIMGGPGATNKVKYFRADHPFVYLICDRSTGAILFMGRVTKP